jgi:hypothetical protein
MIKNPDKYPKLEKMGELKIMQDYKELKMAFQGDFDKLDAEIKVQLKAIKNSDFDKTKVNDIKQICALLIKNNENKVYKISFTSIKL